MNSMTERLEALLATGKETALLRYTLGKAALDSEKPATALLHLQRATVLDPQYSVAWKLLGRIHLVLGAHNAARQAWAQGLVCAQINGDSQVVKELSVFLKRLDKPSH
ncbi:hypothetical protein D3C78_69820 [compost metagenome]